ncbi:MAG: glycosyltransferase [Chloroflexi bacterium]|nr:glycosyltransferase [Chloroflexota bacterium]
MHLISFCQPEEGDPEVSGLQSVCESVEAVAYRGFDPSSVRSLAGFFSATPRAYLDTHSQEMQTAIERAVSAQRFDLVIASQVDMAIYAPAFAGLPAIFEEAEAGVFYDRARKAFSWTSRLRHGLTWAKHRNFMRRLLHDFRACTVVSETEREIMTAIAPPGVRVEVVPNCLDLQDYQGDWGEPEAESLVFTGSFRYAPNYQGVAWFAQQALPLVRRRFPGARLVVTGDTGGQTLPDEENVTLAGYVDDIRPWVARAWCSIAPILQGGGTRLKILEAMALGTPVVSTSKGAQGLGAQPGEHLLLADSPGEFAAAVISLLEDADLRRRISENGRAFVREHYDWGAFTPHYLDFVRSVAA